MQVVQGNLILVCMILAAVIAGCAPKPLPADMNRDFAVPHSIAAGNRMYFSDYNFSIIRPPDKWARQENIGQNELVVWLNRESGSVIEIVVSKAVLNLSYHEIAVNFNRIICNLVQQRSPTARCTIIDEKKVNLNGNQFYRVKIIYQAISSEVIVKSLVYLFKTDDFVYHFLFMEERNHLLAREMIQSVEFHEGQSGNELSGEKKVPFSLADACFNGDIETVELLLRKEVDINAKDNEGVTALAYASGRGHVDIVKILLANKADANSRSNIGSTPLMNAAYMGHVKIVAELVAGGADVNAQSNDGSTALMNAAAHGYIEIVKILLAHDADVNTCEICGLNALWNAISSGHTAIAKMLIKNGANVNAKANDGTTALMNAAFTGNTAVVSMLLRAGASVNVKADNGWTALSIAKNMNHAEIVRMLIKAGAMEDSPREPGLNFPG